MNDIKLNVKALAAMLNITLSELAENSGIKIGRLERIAYRGAKMTADEVIKLSQYTGIPVENIK